MPASTGRAGGLPAFPSDMTLMLALLAGAVLCADLSFAISLGTLLAGGVDTPVRVLQQLETVVLPGLAGYVLYSRWRRRRAVPLHKAPFPEAAETVARLVDEARLRRKPTLLVGQRIGRRAFTGGQPARPYLVLGPELLALCTKDEESRRRFEAVVRHEVAHLRARDVRPYWLATVLRVSNLVTGAFLLYVAALNLRFGHPSALDALAPLRVAVLVVLAELVVRAFLRAREHQADRETGHDALQGVLAAVGSGSGAWHGWRAWLRRHPSPAARLAAVAEPHRLLAFPPAYVFLGATFAGFAVPTLLEAEFATLGDLGPHAQDVIVPTALLVGVPLSVYLAVGIWREHWYARCGGRAPRTIMMAVALAGGVVFGSYLTPFSTIAATVGLDSGIPLEASTLVAVLLGSLLLCCWLAALAAGPERTEEAATAVRRLRTIGVPAACAVGGWVFALVWYWSVLLRAVRFGCSQPEGRDLPACSLPSVEELVARTVVTRFGQHPLTLLMLLVLVGALALAWRLRLVRVLRRQG